MPADALGALQTAVTKTTAFNSTGYDLKTGTPRRGLKARFIVTDYSGAGAGAVWTPAIDHSDDNTTFTRLSQGTALTVGTAAGTSLQFVPFETSKRYVRAALDLSPTTSTPSITYKVDLMLSRP
jgi:hypothetical protein